MSISSGTGLVSGIDFNSIISQLHQANLAPLQLLANKEQAVQTKGQALNSISQAVKSFSDSLASLTTRSTFLGLSASSSDNSVVVPGVADGADPGSFNVRVRQLAQTGRIASQGVASLTNSSVASGDGTFSFRVGGGATQSVAVHAGMSVQELADAINNLDSPGVRASIINDGTDSNPYRLVLNSVDTGAANKVTILSNGTNLNLTGTTIEAATAKSGNTFDGTVASSGTYTGTKTKNIIAEVTTAGGIGAAKYRVSYDGGLTWSANDAFTTSTSPTDITGTAAEGVNIAFAAGTQDFAAGDRFSIDAFAPVLQEAKDAVVEVDGIQISRSTNQFTEIVKGVTFTAVKASDEVQTIKITSSSAGAQTQIKKFADAYNKLIDTISAQTSYNVDTKTASPLFGDSGVNTVLATLRRNVTAIIPGLKDVNSLSSIGVSVDKDGKLAIDSTKLSAALDKDPEAVASVFVQSGKSSSSLVKFVSSTEATRTGSYNVNITQAATQATVNAAHTLPSTGLVADESLTVIVGENQTAIIHLTAGQKLDDIVAAINGELEKRGFAATASNHDGALRINSTAYGSDQKISVSSDQDSSAVGQLGIGTAALTSTGLDVAGTINGIGAKGIGQRLSGNKGTAIEGLELDIFSSSPLTSSLNLTRGIGIELQQQLDALNDSDTGLFTTRAKSYENQIKDMDAQLGVLQARLDKQDADMKTRFNALEQKLSSLQSQGNQLSASLAALIA